MKIIQNSRIRVTITDNVYTKYLAPDRVEKLPSGDERVHSGENETRGRILSNAMKALAHRQVVNSGSELDFDAGRMAVMDGYIYEHLEENTRYDLAELIMRIGGGHRLSVGQQSDYSNAMAYASGRMGSVDIDALTESAREIINSDNPDDRREWQRLALKSSRNADVGIAEKIIEAAKKIAVRDRDYSEHFIFSDLDIEVLTPDDMPEQIGLQDYDSDK